jgi:hypothetical protein
MWERSRQVGHVADVGEKRNVYLVVGGKFECKQLCGRFRHIWGDNIKMDLEEDRKHQLDLSGTW